jgi:hypothetical protein
LATVPSSGTNIRFLSGIPFSNDYKHTRWFDNATDQLNWWANQTTVYTYSDFNIQRVEDKTFIRLNVDIDNLWGVNYVVFYNKTQGKHFYAFVTKLEYIQKNRTDVHIQLDVIQTWMFDMNWQPSYVVREHCPLWNSDGSPVINTIDEGLNYGTEYNTVSVSNIKPYSDLFFLVIVAKTAMHDSNNIKANFNALPQPLNYYVHPFKWDGSTPVVVTTGDFGQTVDSSTMQDILTGIMTSDKTVNAVVSLYVTEYFGYDAPYDGTNITFDGTMFKPVSIGGVTTLHVENINGYSTITQTINNKYSDYALPIESKLLMHPYTVLTLDDFKGHRVNLKNEYINSQNIDISFKGSLGTSNKVSYSVNSYLQDSTASLSHITGLEHGSINTNPNDIPVLNDLLAAFLQGNRNSIQNQKESIVFNGIADGIGNSLGAVASGMTGNGVGVAASVAGVVKGAGNTVLNLQAIQAKQKDINNIPPSMSSMGSNTNFDYGNGIYGLFVIKKQITPEYQKKLSDFFNLYGYKKNEVKMPNFHTRQYWNYVQTNGCVILGTFNHEDLEEIKSVFDGGITLWHTDQIGNYTLSNGVIA